MSVTFVLLYPIIIFPIALVLIQNFKQSKKLAAAKDVSFQVIKWVVLVAALPIAVLFFILLKIFQQSVKLILIVKHGAKFGGLLTNEDAIFATDYPKQIMVNGLFLIEWDESPEEFQNVIKEALQKSITTKLKHNPKVFGSLNVFLGYPYILKDEVNIDECIKKFPTVEGESISKADLLKFNEKCYNELLPNNNKGLWDIHIGSQRVIWYENGEKNVYPVQLRLSHCLTDGAHLYKAIWSLFGDVKVVEATTNVVEKEEIVGATTEKVKEESEKLLNFMLLLQTFVEQIWHMLTWISIITVNSIVVTEEPYNVLFGKKLSGKKFMCIAQEDTPRLMEVAKKIKKRYTGTVLMDIFATAFTASVTEYCQKYTTDMPKYLTCAIMESPKAVNLLNLTPAKKRHQTKLVCTNNVGVYVPKLQSFVTTTTEKIPLVKILQTISRQNRQIHQIDEAGAHLWLFNNFSPVVPFFLSKPFMGKYGVHALLTNVPGPSKLNILNGHLLDHMMFWCPNTDLTGVSFAIMTYGENSQLTLTLNIDSALVPERSQVQEIVDGVFKYIDLLDKATS